MVILWLSTVIIGPILRAALFNDTSALAFMLVTWRLGVAPYRPTHHFDTGY